MPVANRREWYRDRADILDFTSTANGSPESTVFVGGVWVLTEKRYSVRFAPYLLRTPRPDSSTRSSVTPSTAEANEATAPQIAAHSPSDNSKTTISDALRFSGRAAARADRSDRDGPAVMRRLRSAASARWRRFRDTGLAG